MVRGNPIRLHSVAAVSLFIIAAALSRAGYSQEPAEASEAPKIRWAIAVHGGAGSIERLSGERQRAKQVVLAEALDIGAKILAEGGDSLDAVEKVIRHLEDSPYFNAGKGAVLNAAGGFELDASIMDGRTLACGAVAGASSIKNPISVSRRVMTETRHVLLGGDGANKFAIEQGFEPVEQKYFHTEDRYREWRRAQEIQPGDQEKSPADSGSKGTVGCVALDTRGNIAAGTSTGGRNNKLYGRIGDSPVVGAGTYADNRTCGVSGTGIGEEYIRHAVAYDISARMRYLKSSLADSVHTVMHETLREGDGGVIAVSRNGEIVIDFNTPGMSRAAADSNGRRDVRLGPKTATP